MSKVNKGLNYAQSRSRCSTTLEIYLFLRNSQKGLRFMNDYNTCNFLTYMETLNFLSYKIGFKNY